MGILQPLMLLGIYNLIHDNIKMQLEIKKDKSFAINLYLDETAADKITQNLFQQVKQQLLPLRFLPILIVTGVSAGLTKVNIVALTLTSLAFGMMSIILGFYRPAACIEKTMDFGFMCGGILIVLAFLQLCC